MGDFFFFHLLFLILLHKCAFPPQLHYYGSHFPSYTCASSFICTVRGMRLQLGRLCSGKADGPDGVSARLLKDRATQLCQPLSLQLGLSWLHSFSHCLQQTSNTTLSLAKSRNTWLTLPLWRVSEMDRNLNIGIL